MIPETRALVTFSGGVLDRAPQIRVDSAEIGRLWRSGHARVLPFWRGKPLLAQRSPARLGWVGADHPVLEHSGSDPVFLGLNQDTPCFAADISDWEPQPQRGPKPTWFFDPSDQTHPCLPDEARFVDLRGVMAGLSTLEAELSAAARALFNWHAETRHCGRCGARTELAQGGWMRRCTACSARQFPKTEPAVIMPVLHGNRMLLGRAPGWPDGMYSLLAGFVEPGESIEAAVRREVHEETGIVIGPVRYLACQPWPFPGQMMIGCLAEALTTDITPDRSEIEDARWFTREAMLEILQGRNPQMRMPWKGTIAQFLIRKWLADCLD